MWVENDAISIYEIHNGDVNRYIIVNDNSGITNEYQLIETQKQCDSINESDDSIFYCIFFYSPREKDLNNIYFFKIIFTDVVLFDECIFTSKLDFSNAIFIESVFFSNINFEGGVIFYNSTFLEQVSFYRVKFQKETQFNDIKCRSDLDFSQSSFKECSNRKN